MAKKRYIVLSPDGFTIHPTDTYRNLKDAEDAFDEWKKQYEGQGYYSSTNYGKIPLEDLKDYCEFIEK